MISTGNDPLEIRKYLGIDKAKLLSNKGIYTAQEISQQPLLWQKTWSLLADQKEEISDFLTKAFKNEDLDIILTGAGTSAFIGESLKGYFQRNIKRVTQAIATTDLVSHPKDFFREDSTLLLISFARSGNSPESIAAVNLANKCCRKVYHLIITCNPEGELANIESESANIIILPEECNDKSLAMTSSYTCMLLTGLLISQISCIDKLKNKIDTLAEYGRSILNNYSEELWKISALNFKRAVFLGSGPLKGTARESHLKLQELSDGKVICKHDSFLGLRHGPMAVIDDATLLVFLFSNNAYVHRYEKDLVDSINNGSSGIYRIGIAERGAESLNVDLLINLSSAETEEIGDDFMAVCSVLPAQIIGFYKSLGLGLQPDSPSVNGTISRVVKGVNIYSYPEKMEEAKVS